MLMKRTAAPVLVALAVFAAGCVEDATDIDTDGKLDIVSTRSSGNAEVGDTFWFVFKGSCQ